MASYLVGKDTTLIASSLYYVSERRRRRGALEDLKIFNNQKYITHAKGYFLYYMLYYFFVNLKGCSAADIRLSLHYASFTKRDKWIVIIGGTLMIPICFSLEGIFVSPKKKYHDNRGKNNDDPGSC